MAVTKQPNRWQDWTNLVFGLWLFIAPWVLGFAVDGGAAAWNHYIIGGIVAILALIAAGTGQVWEEWLNLILGIWLILAPFITGYADQTAAMWNSIIFGLLIAGDAIWAAQRPAPAHA